jgi:hypothetical protein
LAVTFINSESFVPFELLMKVKVALKVSPTFTGLGKFGVTDPPTPAKATPAGTRKNVSSVFAMVIARRTAAV